MKTQQFHETYVTAYLGNALLIKYFDSSKFRYMMFIFTLWENHNVIEGISCQLVTFKLS